MCFYIMWSEGRYDIIVPLMLNAFSGVSGPAAYGSQTEQGAHETVCILSSHKLHRTFVCEVLLLHGFCNNTPRCIHIFNVIVCR